MRHVPCALLSLAAATLAAAMPLSAQGLTKGEGALRAQGALTVGPVGSINMPVGDSDEGFNTGFTIGAQATYGLGVVALIGEVTYNSIAADEEFFGVDVDGADGMALDAGARVGMPIGTSLGLYAGAVAGVWMGDFDDDFDIVPLVGIQLGPVDLEARYKGLVGDADWFSVGAAVHFRIK